MASLSIGRCHNCRVRSKIMPEERVLCVLACGHYMCIECVLGWLRVLKGSSHTTPPFKCILQCKKTTEINRTQAAQCLLHLPEKDTPSVTSAQSIFNSFYVQDIAVKREIKVVLEASLS